MKKSIIVIAAVIFCVAVSGYYFVKQTPQYSLYKFSKALKEHDADTAFTYVDIDSVVDNLFRDIMSEVEKKPVSSSNPWDQFGNNFAKGLITLMLPTLKEQARGQLRVAIQEPSKSDGKPAPFQPLKGTSWRDFKIETQGKIAMVKKEGDNDFAVKLAQCPDGHWKIVQLVTKDFKPKIDK